MWPAVEAHATRLVSCNDAKLFAAARARGADGDSEGGCGEIYRYTCATAAASGGADHSAANWQRAAATVRAPLPHPLAGHLPAPQPCG